MSPDGKTVLVSNAGQYRQSLSVIDTASGKVRQSLSYDSPEALFVGLAFSPDGLHAYASAGGNNKVRALGCSPTAMVPFAVPVVVSMTCVCCGGQRLRAGNTRAAVVPARRRAERAIRAAV